VTRERGKFVKSPLAPLVMATFHPSSILRAPDDEARRAQKQAMIRDFKTIATRLKKLAVPA
jgi:DNA polymerase